MPMRVIAMLIRKRQAGITLVELVVTIVILSIALVGIVATLNLGVSQGSNTLFELRATALAQSYLDEILSRKFDERSTNSGVPPCKDPFNVALTGRKCSTTIGLDTVYGPDESAFERVDFDDVDDYDGLDEGLLPLALPSQLVRPELLDAQGDPRLGYEGFRVQVAVSLIDVVTPDPSSAPIAATNPVPDDAYDAKLISVTVSDGSSDGIVFSAFKSNF